METKKDMTEWFKLSQQKPWEPGVYECTVEHLGSRVLFGYFDGKAFVRFESDIDILLKNANQGTGAKCVKWRGLASSPSAQKKRAGNKRKTMYVVMDKMEIDKPLGCFMCEIVARNFASKFKWAEVEKIRFRTPEA